jgi:hypothetical protein
VTSARNVSLNSQYNFKVIILFYVFRVGRAFKDVQLRKQIKKNGLKAPHTSASDFKVFTSINHVRSKKK